ncbi:MAG: right-handed parallel beta-helix repeat-containing protein [Thermoplasmatota archaeon]
MRSGKVSLVLLVISLLLGTMIVHDNGPEAASGIAWAPGDAIKIDSDADLISQAASNGWPGSGTESDPYRIENLTITGKSTRGIYIGNTTLHLLIKNCSLSQNNGNDLYLYSCSNLEINNCSLFNTTTGITVEVCKDLFIINNTLVSHRYGMRMSTVNDIIISGNKILNPDDQGEIGIWTNGFKDYLINDNEISNHTDHGFYGFVINTGRITNNTFRNNILNGILMRNYYIDTIVLVDNNTFTGSNIGLCQWTGLPLFIENNTCYNNSFGFLLYGMDIVKENSLFSNQIGMRLGGRDVAYHNTIYDNEKDGIQVDQSVGVLIRDNEVIGNGGAGIFIRPRTQPSDKSIIHNNVIEGNRYGIQLNDSNNNLVHNNTLKDNIGPSIYVVKGSGNEINDNTVISNSDEGIAATSTSYLTLRNNSVTTHNTTALSIDGATYVDVLDNTVKVDDNRALEMTNCAIVTFSWNTVEGGFFSEFSSCIGLELTANTFIDQPHGIRLVQNSMTARDNSFIRSGIDLFPPGSGVPTLVNVDIDSSNTVNGKQIIFERDRSGLDLDARYAGQVILLRVTMSNIKNMYIEDTCSALQIFSCGNLTIDGLGLKNTTTGIKIGGSKFIYVSNSTIENCAVSAVSSIDSNWIVLRSNLFIDNSLQDPLLEIPWNYKNTVQFLRTNTSVVHGNLFYGKASDPYSYAIIMETSGGSKLWDNYFFYNHGTDDTYEEFNMQVWDIFGTNQWFSPQMRGNYWRDLRFPDVDGDGIVDEPYVVGGTGAVMHFDEFPLTTCPIVSPPRNLSTRSGGRSVELYWEAPDQPEYAHIARYNIYRGDETDDLSLMSIVSGSSNSFIDTAVNLGRDYYYQVTAVNQFAESDPSEIRRGGPDTFPPIVVITSPENGSFLNSDEVKVEWEGFDNQSGIDHYEYLLDNGSWVDIGLDLNHTFTGLEEGPHIVFISAFDIGKLMGTTSVNFTIDLTNPLLTIKRPQNGSLATSREVLVEWTSSDELSGIGRVEVRADCCNWTIADRPDRHTLEFTSDGLHAVEVAVIDNAGNRIEGGVSFTIDTYPPELTILAPEDGIYYRSGDVKVYWTGGDNGTGLEGYWFRVNDWNWTSMGMKTDRSLWSMPDGNYSIQVKAVDKAGNVRIEVVDIVIDGTSPNLRIISPVDGSFISASPVTVRWNGTDATSGLDHYEVRLEGDSWRDVGDDITFTMVNLKEGKYLFSVRMWDRAGNEMTVATSFVLDQTRPEVLTYSPEGGEVDVNTVVSATFSERMHKPTFQFRMDDVKGDLEWKGDRLIFVPKTNLSYGAEYNVTLVGWDLAGNRLSTFIWKFTTTNKGTVRGYIVDKKNRPVEFARVYVEGQNETRSREDGFFTIDLESGPSVLVVEAEGFRTVKVDLYIQPGEVQTIDKLVLSENERSIISPLSCLMWSVLVIVSLAGVTAGALWVNSRRRSTGMVEE